MNLILKATFLGSRLYKKSHLNGFIVKEITPVYGNHIYKSDEKKSEERDGKIRNLISRGIYTWAAFVYWKSKKKYVYICK